MAIPVRDFLYLDTVRLSDYLSSVDPGVPLSLRSSTRQEVSDQAEPADPAFASPSAADARSLQETIEERTLTVADRHLFTRYYDRVRPDLPVFDEFRDIELDSVERSGLIEVTRTFERSPLSEMIDSLLEVADLVRRMGADEQRQQAAEMMNMLAILMHESNPEDKNYPMVAEGEAGGATTLFIAQRRSILRNVDEFEGEMTLVGKVIKKVPPGSTVDLFDLLKLFPRSIRRIRGAGKSPKDSLLEMFATWPEQMGGPVSPEALKISGPAVVVAPLAVFN